MRMIWKLSALAITAGLLAGGAPVGQGCNLKAPDARLAGAGCERAWMDVNLKLNDLLMVGTHNSYKTAIPPAVMAALGERGKGLDYAHRPLTDQLDDGARQLEIDVYHDPQGGRFSHPMSVKLTGQPLEPWRAAAMAEPGFKVMHVPDVDVLSSCPTLTLCLETIRRWSLSHPDHAPILLMFNTKTDASPVPGGTGALPMDEAAFDALDAEIRSVFPAHALITPADVQGDYPTLRDAVLHDNWPTLGQARGKVLFALDEGPEKVAVYRGQRRSLEGRVFFVNTDEASPAAAYLTLNDPLKDAERIRKAVKAGFIVRTRADADTVEARVNDVRRREAALSSGAQYVSTDYMRADPRWPGGYQARLEGDAVAACNGVRTHKRCAGLSVESRAAVQGERYLSAMATPDGLRILPPPPKPGSALAEADKRIFAETRAQQGSPRWSVATSDVETEAFDHYACALGVQLTPQTAPRLAKLLDGVGSGLVGEVKDFYRSRRPYLDSSAPICQARTEHLAQNGDYPSGHTAGGWADALVLAELAPDRATAILARGRAFGESRAICGAHSASAVQAGFMSGSVLVAALHGQAAFRADLDAAREELAKVRATAPAPDAGRCKLEREALLKPAY